MRSRQGGPQTLALSMPKGRQTYWTGSMTRRHKASAVSAADRVDSQNHRHRSRRPSGAGSPEITTGKRDSPQRYRPKR